MRRKVIAVSAILCCLLAALSFTIYWATREPLCQGKPIRVWVQEIGNADYGASQLAEEQLQTVRKAAIPVILEAMGAKPGGLGTYLNGWWARIWPSLPAPVRQIAPRPRPVARLDRRMLLMALAHLGERDERVLAPITKELGSTDAEIRFFACQCLGDLALQWADKPAVQGKIILVLINHLKDPAPNVAGSAAAALAKSGPAAQSALPDLVQMLGDRRRYQRFAALIAISKIGGDTNLLATAVKPLLESEEPLMRAYAAYTFGHATGDIVTTLHRLVDLLSSEDNSAREGAAVLLGRLGRRAEPAVPDLRRGLQDRSTDVRISAVRAIWQITGSASNEVSVLRTILAVGDRGQQIEITALLAELGPDAACVLPELMAAMDDTDFLIRRNAVKAVGAIGFAAGPAVPKLKALLNDPFPSIRGCAAAALQKTDVH